MQATLPLVGAIVVFCGAVPALAQVTVTVSPATSYAISTTIQGTTSTVQQGPGATQHVSRVVGVQAVAAAGFGWDTGPYAGLLELGTEFTTFLNLSVLAPNCSADKPVSDLLVRLSAPLPTPVRIQLERVVNLVGAGQLTQFDVDFGDDGTIEMTSTSVLAPVALMLGPTPVDVRVRSAATLPQQGVVQLWTRWSILPDNGVTVQASQSPCEAIDMWVAPMLAGTGGDVAWLGLYSSVLPQFAVVGLQPLPTPLQLPLPPIGGGPCFLDASPDLVFPLGQALIPLTIPAAVRPFSFTTQCVSLYGGGLVNGWLQTVDAQ